MTNSISMWSTIKLPLSRVFTKFRKAFPVNKNAYVHDYEDTWEWFDGVSKDGRIGFNISRQHDWGKSIPDDPVRFSLGLSDDLTVQEVGHQLACALKSTVFTGKINYVVEDDSFEFLPTDSYVPTAI